MQQLSTVEGERMCVQLDWMLRHAKVEHPEVVFVGNAGQTFQRYVSFQTHAICGGSWLMHVELAYILGSSDPWISTSQSQGVSGHAYVKTFVSR